MQPGGGDGTEQMELVADRIEFIELLDEKGPLNSRDIVEALDYSRSTVTRVLRALRDADLIRKTDTGYTATVTGTMAAEQFRRYETASKAILSSKTVLEALPDSRALPVDLLIGADVIEAESEIPVRPLEVVSDHVSGAERVRMYFPTLVNTHLLRVWHQAVVTQSVESVGIIHPDLLTVLKGQYPRLLSEMATIDTFSARTVAGPPYGIMLTTTNDTTRVSVIVYEAGTAVRGVVTNNSAGAVEWAEGELDRLQAEASDVTAELEALGGAVGEGTLGVSPVGGSHQRPTGDDPDDHAADHSLPIALETEGFVRLSKAYFDAHDEAPPEVSWRTGFTLTEVRAGHAVDRLADGGGNLTEKLVQSLYDGNDQVVLGPPGSGKSTICMAVACEWYNRGHGPVLYREHGTGDVLDSTALLEAYLRQSDGHALVVIEDAMSNQARAIFEVISALDDTQDVSFLLDSRTQEWRGDDNALVDARRDAHRHRTVERTEVPSLDVQECQRFIDRYASLGDRTVELSGQELFSLLQQQETGADEEVPPGNALVAQHHLSQQAVSLAADETHRPQSTTALDEAVRRTFERIEDDGTGFALDIAVLTSILNIAGIPVAAEYLYALPAQGDYAEFEEALSDMNGTVLFDPARASIGTPSEYRTHHEAWSVRFLEQVRTAMPLQQSRSRFGRCVSRLLALADDFERRNTIERHLDGRAPHIHRINADTTFWADEVAERVFRVGVTHSSAASLFGETAHDTIELPRACSAGTVVKEAYWRGLMNKTNGQLDRSEREFQELQQRAASVAISNEQDLKPVNVGVTRGYESDGSAESVDAETWRRQWQAIAFTELGEVARLRGELETAAEYHQRGLSLCDEVGGSHAKATALKNLGNVLYKRGRPQEAKERYEQSLSLYREVGDKHGEAMTLVAFGNIARDRGEVETAKEYYTRSLSLYQELDEPYEEALPLLALGAILRKSGELDAAANNLDRSLTLYRKSGHRSGEAMTLRELGLVAKERDELTVAQERLEDCLSLSREMGEQQGSAHTLCSLGEVVLEQGNADLAEQYIRRSLSLCRDIGDRHGEATALLALGRVSHESGAVEAAKSQFADAAELCMEMDAGEVRRAIDELLGLCKEQGWDDAAADWRRRAIEFAERTGHSQLQERFTDTEKSRPSHSE